MILIALSALLMCMVRFEYSPGGTNGRSMCISFEPAIHLYWNLVSPGGSQSGLSFNTSRSRFVVENWNGKIHLQHNDKDWFYGEWIKHINAIPPEEDLDETNTGIIPAYKEAIGLDAPAPPD